MIERRNIVGLRCRLLLSACAVVAPTAAWAQDVINVPPNRTAAVVVDGTDQVTVAAGGSIINAGTATVQRAINLSDVGNNGGSPNLQTGPTITNSGTIQASAAATGRAIDSVGNLANRTVTITNNAGAFITGNSDAIRIANTAGGSVATGSIVTITNSGTIESLNNPGATVNTALQPNNSNAGSGILTEVLSGATINITNNAGGIIRGSRGVVTGANSTIVNNGTITGNTRTGSTTYFSSGEALRLGGGDAATNTSTVTLGVGSLTQTTDLNNVANPNGQAIVFGGLGAHVINVNAGATIIGSLVGSTVAAVDTLNLTAAANSPAQATIAQNLNFEILDVQAGTWVANTTSVFSTGATIETGATLRLDAGGVVRSAITIAQNGELRFNRADELLQAVDPSVTTTPQTLGGDGNLRITGTGTFALSAGANTYKGTTSIDAGRLRADGVNAFSPNSAVTVGAAGTLDLNGFDQTIAGLSGAGAVNAATGGILTTGGAANATYSGVFSGAGGLTKVGTGIQTLSGASTATGLLRASVGGVALTGNWRGAGQVDNGATLSGTGVLAGLLTVADGGIVAPGNGAIGTLTTGGLALSGGSILNFDFGAPGTSDRIVVNGDLVLDGTLNATNVGGFGQGVYRLIDYTGALTNSGLDIGTLPANTDRTQVSIQTTIGQQVNLVYGGAAGPTQFWDGTNTTANGVIDGGTGSWTNAITNWTTADGAVNQSWQSGLAVFQGTGGTVTIDDAIAFTGMQFSINGYNVVAGGGALQATSVQTNLRVDPGITATIAAPIGGAGGVVKNDTGTLILGGVNTYAGATVIAGGVVQAVAVGALPTTSAVSLAAGTTLDLAASQTVASIAGTGVITLSGGSLTAGGDDTSSTFGGVLSGAGGLTKAGAGTLTLTGVNSYAGGTTVMGGTLAAGQAGSIGAGALTVAAGATADLAGFAQSVGTLSGAGVVQLGTNGNLTTTAATNSTFSGQLTGTGATFTKAGTGALTLSGTATNFTGATAVNGGRLVLANAGALANTAAVTVATTGTLEVTADKQLGSFEGAGGLALTGARLTLGGAADSAFTGVASGTGGVTQAGTGTLTLAGTNTYTGDSVASAGTLLVNGRVAGDASATGTGRFGGTGVVAGTLTIANGATLSPGTTGVGTLTVGGLVLNNTSNLAYDLGAPGTAGDRVQVNGNLTLDGRLNVINAGGFGQGVYRLIDYTGALTDNLLDVASVPAGTALAQTQVQTSVANQVNLVVSQALPDIQFWDGANTTANVRVDGGTGSWNNRAANWTNAAGDTNFRWGSRFAVFQGAAGTVTVDDAITFTGMQFMTNGYVVAAGTGTLTTAEAAAALRVDPGITATIGAAIGGTGGIAKLDAGTLVLNGANTYAGATALNGGILRAGVAGALPAGTTVTVATGATLDLAASQTIANLAGSGAVTLTNGSLTTGGAGTATTYAGVISGAGGLTKVGAGIFTLTGANSFTGATAVNAGTLALGTGGQLGQGSLTLAVGTTVNLGGNSTTTGALAGAGAITLGAGTLTTNAATSTNYAGVISGTGGLVKAGTGTLTLSGNNTYTGTTAVRAGTLALTSNTSIPITAAVSIDAGATLALASNKTLGALTGAGAVTLGSSTLTLAGGDFAGVISGTGALTKNGTSTLTLSGVNTYSGATAIQAGQLLVNGTLPGSVSVQSGAVLGGTGTVGGLTVNGTLAPGNGVGTLTASTVTFAAGSTFQVQTTATGQADQLAVTGAATINGGTVQVLSGGSSAYPVASAFPILTAGSFTTSATTPGVFAGVTSDFAFLTPSLRYTPTAVLLVLVRNDQTFTSIGQTDNQRAVAGVIQGLGSGALYDTTVLANADTARTNFDLLSGEIDADLLTVANRGVQDGRTAVLDRLATPTADGTSLWLDIDAAHRSVDAGNGLASLDWDRSAEAGGIEASLDGFRAGFGYRHSDDAVQLDARASFGKVKTDTAIAYVGATFGGLHLGGGATYSWHSIRADRVLGTTTLRATETSRENGRARQVFGEAAFDIGRGDNRWGPYAGVSAASTVFSGATEQGTSFSALTLGRPRLTTTVADYGLRASGPLLRLRNKAIGVAAAIGGRSYFDDDIVRRTVRFAGGGQPFTVEGVDFGKTALTTKVALSAAALGGHIDLGFNGELSDEYRSYGGRLSAGWRF